MSKEQQAQSYLVAISAPFAEAEFRTRVERLPGRWLLVSDRQQLNPEFIASIDPRYIFFPHWSYLVPRTIHERWDCVCFHSADVPFGRGGTPIQNLISRGHRATVLSALRMVDEVDAGPVYMKRPLSLEGLGEEIYLRTARLTFDMIEEIVRTEPSPKPQVGDAIIFGRRTPAQSVLKLEEMNDDLQIFDFIRMLDAEGYPCAFIEIGDWIIELTRPALRRRGVQADAKIRRKEKDA